MTSDPKLHAMSLHPQLLRDGFWLYVWRIGVEHQGERDEPRSNLLYVGRTGDSSSPKAAPPYRRMGQHLGHQRASNALRKHLTARGVVPEDCGQFDFYAYGPIFPIQLDMKAHIEPRDIVAALECKLASALKNGGYDVMNIVRSRKPLNNSIWKQVHKKFREIFPDIAE